MELFRIGSKVISRSKLIDAIDAILDDRASGATQEEAACNAGVQRSFVSILETTGEIRRGPRVALVGFPVANGDEVRALAESHAVDFVLVVSQSDREYIENGSPAEVFNQLLETLSVLRDFDTLVLIASDWRIHTLQRILGTEVVGIPLGSTPIREDKAVDISELDTLLAEVMAAKPGTTRRKGRVSGLLRDAAEDLAGRWIPSKKS